ncbi:MAG TPA: pyrroline-5-carboxylate reductase [Acidimicrobiales bacterium]|nr:pyrroline-5-carboxylate reductase [Acidimicrobiales bacterium]
MKRLAIYGGGRMGEALIGGLLASGWGPPSDLAVVEVSPVRREQLYAALDADHRGLSVGEDPVPAEGAVIAVKPSDVEAACRAMVPQAYRRVLSVAAGVSLASLEKWLGALSAPRPPAVVRAMPNTAALVGAGAAAVAAGTGASDDDVTWAEEILGSVGTVVRVAEGQLDAVTGLSGSGPAYVFLLAEALVDAGVLVGLPRPVARSLAVQTLLGAARLLDETGETPEALRAAVTSPGGTTAAGLRALESRAVRAAVLEAVVAASERSRQLGGG